MKRFWFIALMISLLSFSMVSAATVVTLDSLGTLNNGSYQDTQTIPYNMKVTGNSSTWTCILYGNENGTNGVGSWRAIVTDSGVSNNTNTTLATRSSVAEVTGLLYNWDVFCNSTNDTVGDWGAGSNTSQTNVAGNMTFGVDVTDPTITVTPADVAWQTTSSATITATVVDNNPNTCIITSTINTTSNTTQASTAYAGQAYTNATALNFTGFDSTTDMADNNTGAYQYSVACTDDAGNSVSVATRTFYIDTVAPSAFSLLSAATDSGYNIPNGTSSTDYTPTLTWNLTTELNFSRYEIWMNSSVNTINVSTKATVSSVTGTLGADKTYSDIYLMAYDLAGNSVKSGVSWNTYSTDSTGRGLLSGWSTIMNTGNAKNLSDYLTQTSATTACILNSTHDFVCFTSGGSDGDTEVPSGEAYFVYLATASTYSDAVTNVTAVGVGSTFNLTNQTTTDWNINCNRDATDTSGKTLQEIDSYVNCNALDSGCSPGANNATNIDRMSYYDWDAGTTKYVGYRGNWSINNDTVIDVGECAWMFMNTAASTVVFNWTAV